MKYVIEFDDEETRGFIISLMVDSLRNNIKPELEPEVAKLNIIALNWIAKKMGIFNSTNSQIREKVMSILFSFFKSEE